MKKKKKTKTLLDKNKGKKTVLLRSLENMSKHHLQLGMSMLKADGGKMFGLDILALASIKRSMSLIKGFTALIKQYNYSSAAALVRLQLDTCLRFYAAFIVDEPHKFANEVLKGKHVRNMKDRKGKRMTDRYLVVSLTKKYEWMTRVYESTSGFIHLSDKHIFLSIDESHNSDKTISHRVAADDKNIPIDLWIEMISAFKACTEVFMNHIEGWINTKNNPELVELIRKKRDELESGKP